MSSRGFMRFRGDRDRSPDCPDSVRPGTQVYERLEELGNEDAEAGLA